MQVVDAFNQYKKAIGDRTDLYRTVCHAFQVKSALYPGSHIDIMPSFVIPQVTYIDSFKGTLQFFKDIEAVNALIHTQKTYEEACQIRFFAGDYKETYDIEQVDLLISQFAGFVGQETKAYLKDGGILLSNDSHGDATLAFMDEDYDFIGVVNARNQIETDHLDTYFQFARKRPIDLEKVKLTMKGPKYKEQANHYLFKKRSKK